MMDFDTTVFIGIDTAGGRHPCTYAAVDVRGHVLVLADGTLEQALDFVDGQAQAVVAVNAPPRPNLGLVKERARLSAVHFPGRNTEMRLAESTLREHGITVASTPSKRELCAHWMQVGFELYRHLEKTGYVALGEEADRLFLETHPQACFTVLLGQIPLSRSSLEGRLQRQLALYEAGLDVRDAMDYYEEITRHRLLRGELPLEQVYLPEELDALAAAYVACLSVTHPEKTLRVGDAREGEITLPVAELKEKYS